MLRANGSNNFFIWSKVDVTKVGMKQKQAGVFQYGGPTACNYGRKTAGDLAIVRLRETCKLIQRPCTPREYVIDPRRTFALECIV